LSPMRKLVAQKTSFRWAGIAASLRTTHLSCAEAVAQSRAGAVCLWFDHNAGSLAVEAG
jgi:hypothetical protein